MSWITKRIDKLPSYIEFDGIKFELEIVVKPYYMAVSYVSPVDEKDVLIMSSITKHAEPFDGNIYQHLDNLTYDVLLMIKNEIWKYDKRRSGNKNSKGNLE